MLTRRQRSRFHLTSFVQTDGHARYLRPRLQSDLIERKRLFPEHDRTVVIVVGPAGSGKTSLVLQWLENTTDASVWLQLGSSDNQLERFVGRLVAGIQNFAPGSCVTTTRALGANDVPSPQLIGELLASDLNALSQRITIVLDDMHHVESPAIRQVLAPLFRAPSPNVRFVFISRTQPGLALTRLSALGGVTEIGPADLQFTDHESRRLLTSIAANRLTPRTLSELVALNNGWAVGLYFTALALRESDDPEGVAASIVTRGEPRSLDFLREEVFERLSPGEQQFLTGLSCAEMRVSSLCPSLCGELDDQSDAAALLTYISTQHAFIEAAEDSNGAFRLHPVFGQMLRQQLWQRHHGTMIAELLNRASSLVAEHPFGEVFGWKLNNGVSRLDDHNALVDHANSAVEWVDRASGFPDDRIIDLPVPVVPDPASGLCRNGLLSQTFLEQAEMVDSAEPASLGAQVDSGQFNTAASPIVYTSQRSERPHQPSLTHSELGSELNADFVTGLSDDDGISMARAGYTPGTPRWPVSRRHSKPVVTFLDPLSFIESTYRAFDKEVRDRAIRSVDHRVMLPGQLEPQVLQFEVEPAVLEPVNWLSSDDSWSHDTAQPKDEIINHHRSGQAQINDQELTESSRPVPATDQSAELLTARETEVLELLQIRLTNSEIAERLFISPLTVKRHNANIFEKLGVGGRREAVRRAIKLGLLSPTPTSGRLANAPM